MSRVVVIGLDGVPCSLLRRLVQEGVMPEVGRLLDEGDLAAMDTVYPPLSSVSWTTFFTGVEPGRHRIFGFFESQIDAYGIWFQSLNDVKMPALCNYAQAYGKRTISLNLPGTYPAPPLNGVMVSGFIAEDLARATYPKLLLPLLAKTGYLLDLSCERVAEEPERFWAECEQSLRARTHVTSVLLQHEPFDLFISVITETDRVQHFFFDALEDPWHPQREACYRFYRAVDAAVGHWVQQCRPDDELVLLADHGFCRVEQEVNVNHWLLERGYLAMKTSDPKAPLSELDPSRTKAFALDPGRIFLNIKGRQASGCVRPEEAPALREELAAGLRELSVKVPWSAAPFHPITHCFRREELYAGPWAHLAADLILHSADGYDLKGGLNRPKLNEIGSLTGMHTYGDAMLYIRGRRWTKATPRIVDLAPTLLHLLGVPVPTGLDSEVIV